MIGPCLFHKTKSMNLFCCNICAIKQYLRPSTVAGCTTHHSLNSATGPYDKPYYTLRFASVENFSLVMSWIFIKQSNVNFFNTVLFAWKRGSDQIKSIAKKAQQLSHEF